MSHNIPDCIQVKKNRAQNGDLPTRAFRPSTFDNAGTIPAAVHTAALLLWSFWGGCRFEPAPQGQGLCKALLREVRR